MGGKRSRCLRCLSTFHCLQVLSPFPAGKHTEPERVLMPFSSVPYFYSTHQEEITIVLIWSLLVLAQLSLHNNQITCRENHQLKHQPSVISHKMICFQREWQLRRTAASELSWLNLFNTRAIYTPTPHQHGNHALFTRMRHWFEACGHPFFCLNKNIVIWWPLGFVHELGSLSGRQCFTSTKCLW